MRAGLQTPDIRRVPDWSRVGIGDSHEESGRSREIWDSWTLSKGFREVRGHATPEKIRNLRSSNCWKCIQIVNPATTTLVFYHFKSFTIAPGGPFLPLGGCVRTPRTPPAYGPAESFNIRTFPYLFSVKLETQCYQLGWTRMNFSWSVLCENEIDHHGCII